MSRTGRRISRSLIGVLIITLVLGLIFYFKDVKKTQAKEPSPLPLAVSRPPATLPAVLSPATQPQIARSTTPTPTTRPGIFNPTAAPTISKNPLADAQAKKEAGDLLAARRILNDAMQSGQLSGGDAESSRKMLAEINQTVIFSSRRFDADEYGGTYSVQTGDRLARIAPKYEVTPDLLARLNNLSDPTKLRAGATIKVVHGPFSAVVSKSKFNMDIYIGPPGEKGSMYVTSFPVGLGKDDSTPTGAWIVEQGKKIKDPTYYSPRGEGVIDKSDPKNPLGERWIGLSGINGSALGKSSYGIHGTIDESTIGKQESMGCIRMHNADVELVYDLLVEGKSVVVVKE